MTTVFCPKCSNMLYETVEDNKLLHVCNACSYQNEILDKAPSVYKKFYTQEFLTDSFATNPYTHLDPTLPRLRNKKCINADCETHTQLNLFECKYITIDDLKKEMPELSNIQHIKTLNSFENHWLGTADKLPFALDAESLETKDDTVNASDFHERKNTKREYRNDYLCRKYENDIIYIKYDNANMKYMYICCCCQTSWKN